MPANDLEAVRRVLDAHREEIQRRFGAVGTGIGKRGSEYVITVYLKAAKDRPESDVAVEGIELKFEVTGEFHSH